MTYDSPWSVLYHYAGENDPPSGHPITVYRSERFTLEQFYMLNLKTGGLVQMFFPRHSWMVFWAVHGGVEKSVGS